MGGGIAMCFIQKKIPVVLIDAKQEWLDAGVKKIVGLYEAQMKKKKMDMAKFRGLMKLLMPTLDYGMLKVSPVASFSSTSLLIVFSNYKTRYVVKEDNRYVYLIT